ncbi:MAG TPA: glycoside hydrolase family 16 protein [Anaerolineales bacterium]|nr:glycoside hydrolase family 16 protein [Anaerolineales bacterium]
MKRRLAPYLLCLICALIVGSCTPGSNTPPAEASPATGDGSAQILFDDFSYSTHAEMTSNGWILRDGSGWPGVSGATFRPENVSFVDYPDQANNRLLRMTSSTDGTRENTYQTQICHQRKYLEGTYAARIRFSDEPISGTDGDEVVQTFYTITPYVQALDPDYSEMDYEYLPNGGWGGADLTFYVTTWETVQIEPWNADNTSNSIHGSLAGWHTLVTQVSGGTVRYFIDGTLIAQHGGAYYPDAAMSINFNLWFIDGGLTQAEGIREYQEDIDWVFHEAGTLLMPDQVAAKVDELRNASITFQDTVFSGIQESPCDL